MLTHTGVPIAPGEMDLNVAQRTLFADTDIVLLALRPVPHVTVMLEPLVLLTAMDTCCPGMT